MNHIVDDIIPIKIVEVRDGFLILKNNFCTFYLSIGNFDIYKRHDNTFIRTPGQRFKTNSSIDELLNLITSYNNRFNDKIEDINRSIDKINQRLDQFEVDIELAPGNEESLKVKEHFEKQVNQKVIDG